MVNLLLELASVAPASCNYCCEMMHMISDGSDRESGECLPLSPDVCCFLNGCRCESVLVPGSVSQDEAVGFLLME